MANNIIRRTWKQGGMVNIEDLRGSAFQAEDGGHTFLISGLDENGDALALSGTPAGVLLRADGQDVTLTCSVSEGVVSATLPANAYVVPGRVGITIFLTSGGQKTAIYAAVGSVATTSSGIVAPPAGSDVVDLVNAIATAVATIPASYTDLMAAVAPTYSTSALYAVGSYAWYSGKLYRCTTAITSGETWTSAHWTQANLGSDVSDLKSAFINTSNAILNSVSGLFSFEQGRFDRTTGNTAGATTVIRTTDFIPENVVRISCPAISKFVIWAWKKSDGSFIGHIQADGTYGTASNYLYETNHVLDWSAGYKYKITFYKEDNTEIGPSYGSNCITWVSLIDDLKIASVQGSLEMAKISGATLPIITELGSVNTTTGANSNITDGTRIRTAFIPCEELTEYTIKVKASTGISLSHLYPCFYSNDDLTSYIGTTSVAIVASQEGRQFTTAAGTKYLRLRIQGENMTVAGVTVELIKSDSAIEKINDNYLNATLKFISMSETIAEDDYSKLASNLPGNTYCWIGSSWFTDLSTITSGSYWLFTYAAKSGYTTFAMQYVIEPLTGEMWSRKRSNNTVWEWGDWSQINDPANTPLWKGVLATDSDLNDVAPLTMYGLSSSGDYTNKPNLLTSGYLFTVAYNTTFTMQIAFDLSGNNVYSRRKNASGWNSWRCGVHDISAKYYAFGDSTTYGQIGVMEGQTGVRSSHNYPACVGRLLHMEVYNQGVKGEGLISDETDIYNRIENLDMTGAKLVTVGWAYNDRSAWARMNFGTAQDTDADNTYIGKYYKIMKTFQVKCPSAKIILVTGYGRTDGTPRSGDTPPVKPTLVHQFDGTYTFLNGDVSAKTMYDTMEEMCHLHGWSCVNQAKGTVFNQYNVDTVIGDQIHPTDEGYLLYGNFLAARIASMYGNIASW